MKYSLYLCSESWVGNDSMNMHEATCYMQVTCLTRVTARAAAPCFPPSLLSASLRNKEVSWKRRRRGISRELLFFPASMKHLHTNEADTHPRKQKNLRARMHARTHAQADAKRCQCAPQTTCTRRTMHLTKLYANTFSLQSVSLWSERLLFQLVFFFLLAS